MIGNIQALRAIAALLVVMSHVLKTSHNYGLDAGVLTAFAGWSEGGVDIFFVISGFVMTLTQSQNPRTPGRFALNRIARIVPPYWFATLLLIGFYVAVPSAFTSLEITPARALASLLFVSQPLLGAHPVLHVGWTLEYEMLFYALFAACIVIPGRFASTAALIAVLGLTTLCGVTDTVVFEFVFGILLGHAYLRNLGLPALAITTAAMLAVFLLKGLSTDPDDMRVVHWGIPAAAIVAAAIVGRQIAPRLMIYLGEASYSIYLLQVLAIPFWYKVATRLLPGLDAVVIAVGGLVFCAVVGAANYQFIERPMTRLARRWMAGGRNRFAS